MKLEIISTERSEYDLVMNIDAKVIELKVKMYHTTSSMDVQGRAPNYNKVFNEFGNKTVAVHFVEDILKQIKEEITKQMDLDDVNRMMKERVEQGVAIMTSKKKANLKTANSANTRQGKYKFGLAKPLKTKPGPINLLKPGNLLKMNLQKVVLELNNKEETLAIQNVSSIPCAVGEGCNLRFPSLEAVNIHKLNAHSEEAYRCEECDFKSFEKSLLESHIKVAHMMNVYNCGQCEYVFKVKEELEYHITQKHSDAQLNFIKCNDCAERFETDLALVDHIWSAHETGNNAVDEQIFTDDDSTKTNENIESNEDNESVKNNGNRWVVSGIFKIEI